MGQRVERDTTITYAADAWLRVRHAGEAGVPLDPDDLDGHNWLYDHLQIPVNDAPALFGPGDGRLLALARVRCSDCRASVAVVNALDARPRGGTVVYDVLTQHPPAVPRGPMRQVYVVLGAPGDPRGRLPIARPSKVLTTCRAHGLL